MTTSWWIGGVEIPTRIVLAPMAGVSVQAFRRQGRRFGAGLVCSEMVSACGLSYGNERTLGYLRIARDEHPLAVQIFGSQPELLAEAAQMVVDAGADIVDINFGCPVRKVTKTGAGASALEDHDLACRLAGAVVEAVDVPVTVKMRRGVRNGSRTALDLGPKLEAIGVAALTLHPRSAQQMYTGFADHSLTAELVSRVAVPVMASGDIVDHSVATRVLADTGAAAVMIGRGAQGRPWARWLIYLSPLMHLSLLFFGAIFIAFELYRKYAGLGNKVRFVVVVLVNLGVIAVTRAQERGYSLLSVG